MFLLTGTADYAQAAQARADITGESVGLFVDTAGRRWAIPGSTTRMRLPGTPRQGNAVDLSDRVSTFAPRIRVATISSTSTAGTLQNMPGLDATMKKARAAKRDEVGAYCLSMQSTGAAFQPGQALGGVTGGLGQFAVLRALMGNLPKKQVVTLAFEPATSTTPALLRVTAGTFTAMLTGWQACEMTTTRTPDMTIKVSLRVRASTGAVSTRSRTLDTGPFCPDLVAARLNSYFPGAVFALNPRGVFAVTFRGESVLSVPDAAYILDSLPDLVRSDGPAAFMAPVQPAAVAPLDTPPATPPAPSVPAEVVPGPPPAPSAPASMPACPPVPAPTTTAPPTAAVLAPPPSARPARVPARCAARVWTWQPATIRPAAFRRRLWACVVRRGPGVMLGWSGVHRARQPIAPPRVARLARPPAPRPRVRGWVRRAALAGVLAGGMLGGGGLAVSTGAAASGIVAEIPPTRPPVAGNSAPVPVVDLTWDATTGPLVAGPAAGDTAPDRPDMDGAAVDGPEVSGEGTPDSVSGPDTAGPGKVSIKQHAAQILALLGIKPSVKEVEKVKFIDGWTPDRVAAVLNLPVRDVVQAIRTGTPPVIPAPATPELGSMWKPSRLHIARPNEAGVLVLGSAGLFGRGACPLSVWDLATVKDVKGDEVVVEVIFEDARPAVLVRVPLARWGNWFEPAL